MVTTNFVTKICPSHFRACAQWTKYSSCSCLSPSMIKDTNDTNLFITCLRNELWVLELWTHVDSSFFPNHSTRHVGKLWQKLYHLAFSPWTNLKVLHSKPLFSQVIPSLLFYTWANWGQLETSFIKIKYISHLLWILFFKILK